MQKIMFATPCYGNQVTARFFKCALDIQRELINAGVEHDWMIRTNESLVHRARMGMVADFLKSDATHLFWIDADIEFSVDDVGKIWTMAQPIAVGVYAMKKRDGNYYAAWIDGKLVRDLDQYDGPVEVDYAGTGFMLISRAAIEQVYEHVRKKQMNVFQTLRHLPEIERDLNGQLIAEIMERFAPDYEGPEELRAPTIFQTPVHNDTLESEDYHFCRLAREAGLSIWMDPSVRLLHWGLYPYGSR